MTGPSAFSPLRLLLLLGFLCGVAAAQATVVPTDIQQPGTQPFEATYELEAVNKCDNCHGDYDAAVEPAGLWRGSMMSHAARDPIYWASVAIAEQDFPGAGDLCLRCHTPRGWIAGRSTPTDGSALAGADGDAVSCDACHALVNPDEAEHPGFQTAPFLAHDGGAPPVGNYGSGQFVFATSTDKLGPYSDPASPHQAMQSEFHRSSDLCGTCHDVSNPAVGDLAPNNGAQVALDPLSHSGVPGAPVEGKAAFNNPPFAYGIVERTFSEHVASAFDSLPVASYESLPPELQQGSIRIARDAAVAAGNGGNYVDGATRTFTCQTCHLPAVTGKGCDKNNAPVRTDLPLHDMTGGNTWIPDAMAWIEDQPDRSLVLGSGLSTKERTQMLAGKTRARTMLQTAAALSIEGDSVRVVNLTGHKLISGYPEGRRMWLRVTWRDSGGAVLRVDGEYGSVTATIDGTPTAVDTILDLHAPNTRIWEAHFGMSQEWAAALVGLGYSTALPLRFERLTGSVELTLGQLAALPPGSVEETFHFVLNDVLTADNRIPPYGMAYTEAAQRNVLPVPETLYGAPEPGGTYRHWDEVPLAPPPGAASADVELLYQTTSFEYVRFLALANTGAIAFLADTGDDLQAAWLATGMAAPELMASATWIPDCNGNGVPDTDDLTLGTSADLDGNGVPDECDPLAVDVDVISLAAGGTQALTLRAGPALAGRRYRVFTSGQGTSPGTPIDGLILPLNDVVPGFPPVARTDFGASSPGDLVVLAPTGRPAPVDALFVAAGFGRLGPSGAARARVDVPPGANPTLAGLTFHHAYVVWESELAVFVSNAVPLSFTP